MLHDLGHEVEILVFGVAHSEFPKQMLLTLHDSNMFLCTGD
jgi:hypothetical protein